MAAAAVPAVLIAVYDLQMRNFPNIGRSMVRTPDFITLDLAKVKTAVAKFCNFDLPIDFKAEFLLPDINNLYVIRPKQTRLLLITKIKFEKQSLSPTGLSSQQAIMPIVHFLEPMTICIAFVAAWHLRSAIDLTAF